MAGDQVSQLETRTEPTPVLLGSELKAKAINSGLKQHEIRKPTHSISLELLMPEQLRLSV